MPRTHYPALVAVASGHELDSRCHVPDIPFNVFPPADRAAGVAYGQNWAAKLATPEQLAWLAALGVRDQGNRYHSGHADWNACAAAELMNDASLLRAHPTVLAGIRQGALNPQQAAQ